ncbi:sensor histidine kinase [Paenibacillus zanthoxyli]|uniref:sensor histidine kinase n=1 Tax=Paenibacillus zanthoxyli TaxID=369399 RepID=UPI0018DBF62E|nr:HAMP domain-containing sensor histidine kinase [Paenibacillus zanthoxyli]
MKWIIQLGLVGLLVLIFNVEFTVWGINHQLFIPANEPINKAKEIQGEIVKADYINPRMIPSELDYAIFNKRTKKMVTSNLSFRNQEKAKSALQSSEKDRVNSFIRYDSQYETIMIYYNLKVQFMDPILRKTLPNPGIWLSVLSILLYCMYLIWNIRNFSRVIIQENEKLIKVARKIKERDLNIAFPEVRFNEYQDVMNAMESLSEALIKSIHKEIEITNLKSEQISYLVHDIKIPLTVIKGNIELLEMTRDEDAWESFSDIMNSIHQIERYIQEVIDINLNNKPIHTNKEEVSVRNFLCKLETEVSSLGSSIMVNDFTEEEIFFLVDEELLVRAINNIVLNGVERTPLHEKVKITVRQGNDCVLFIISDRGPGFSEEALRKGTELFYTENYGRTHNNHYGLGLTFTEKVIKQHNGRMTLRNDSKHFGEVLMELPVIKESAERCG